MAAWDTDTLETAALTYLDEQFGDAYDRFEVGVTRDLAPHEDGEAARRCGVR